MGTRLLEGLNRVFPPPPHPFNMQNDGTSTYAEWQYEKGEATIEYYLRYVTKEDMFQGKTVLDIGCGAGGKDMYYLSQGCEKLYGIEIVEKYRDEAEAFAAKLGYGDRFVFVYGDAASTGFPDDFFDSIIMNDAMEHVAKPELVLEEAYRILKPGGRLFVNFPPYDHPFGAHLSDAIGIPWAHRLFREKNLISAYKKLVSDKPDAADRLAFRFGVDERGREYIAYINKMSIRRFKRILKATPFKTRYYHEEPLRSLLRIPAKLPVAKEFFVKMVVAVLEK